MATSFKLLRTDTVHKRPTAAQLSIGELGLNYDSSSPGLFFEDDAGSVRKIGPMEVGSSAPNSSPAGSSGNSVGELWLDNSTGSVLKYYDGSSWSAITNAQTGVAGDTQVIFNSSGSLTGDSNFTFDADNDVLSVTEIESRLDGPVVFEAKSAGALSKGDVVYVSSISGNFPVVAKAQANSASTMPAFGIANNSASGADETVNVITLGTIKNVDTDTVGFSLGDTLYVSATVAGGLVDSAPTGESNLIQNIGQVQRVHASAGEIKVGGAGRTNAVPNLNSGNIFVGNGSNQAITDSFLDVLDDQAGISSSASSTALTIASGGGVTLASTLNVTGLATFTAGASGTRKLIASGVDITGNTSYTVTGIPSWATRITVVVMNISLSGDDEISVQLGTSGGDITSGYHSSSEVGGSNVTVIDSIASSFDGSTTTFTLQQGGTDAVIASAQQLIIDLGGVIQRPSTDYSVSGSSIIFTTPPQDGLTFAGRLLGNTESKTDAFVINATSSESYSGRLVIEKGTSDLYVCSHQLTRTNGNGLRRGSGQVSGFSGTIDRVVLRSSLGSNTFDGSSKVTVYAEG